MSVHELEPGGKIMLSVLEGNIRLGPGEIRSLAHMNRVTQRGAGRHVNLVQQMPEPRKLTAIPGLALRLQMAAITFGNVHAVRTLPLVAFDMMFGK